MNYYWIHLTYLNNSIEQTNKTMFYNDNNFLRKWKILNIQELNIQIDRNMCTKCPIKIELIKNDFLFISYIQSY